MYLPRSLLDWELEEEVKFIIDLISGLATSTNLKEGFTLLRAMS